MGDPSLPHRQSRREWFGLTGGSALLGALASLSQGGCASEAKEDILIDGIDTHIHAESSKLPGVKSKPIDVLQLYAEPTVKPIADRLKREMAEARLSHVLGMGSLESPDTDPLGVARTLAVAESVPGLHAIGVANPQRIGRDHLKRVEAQLDKNRGRIVALKAYLGYLHFGPEDPAYIPYYKIAAKYEIPVVFHTGDNWSTTALVKFAHPLRVDEVAVTHPEVRFVLAHFGNPWLIDAAEVIFKNENVWADLSGLVVGDSETFKKILDLPKLPDAVAGVAVSDLKKAMDYVGDYSKFLYGSDWPLAPMASYRRLIEAIIPEEHHAKVFRANAEHLFKLKK
jgi:uncharacterized protein